MRLARLTGRARDAIRRTFAGELSDAGQDISTIAAMLGHVGVKTTA